MNKTLIFSEGLVPLKMFCNYRFINKKYLFYQVYQQFGISYGKIMRTKVSITKFSILQCVVIDNHKLLAHYSDQDIRQG